MPENNAIICGGRTYSCVRRFGKLILEPRQDDIAWLDEIHAKHTITCVFSGCATGADALGEYWAELRGIPVRKFPPDWKRLGKAAGPVRNGEMVRDAHIWISFPGGSGTIDCMNQATAHGLPLFFRQV